MRYDAIGRLLILYPTVWVALIILIGGAIFGAWLPWPNWAKATYTFGLGAFVACLFFAALYWAALRGK